MARDKVLSMLLRIRLSPDGEDFLEYLKELSEDNYNAWKTDPTDMNDIHKGYAVAIDNLIQIFNECGANRKKPADTPSIQ